MSLSKPITSVGGGFEEQWQAVVDGITTDKPNEGLKALEKLLEWPGLTAEAITLFIGNAPGWGKQYKAPLLFWLVAAVVYVHWRDKAMVDKLEQAIIKVLASGMVLDANVPIVDTTSKYSNTALWEACDCCFNEERTEACVRVAKALLAADQRGLLRVPLDINKKYTAHDGTPWTTPLADVAMLGEHALPMLRLVAHHPGAKLDAVDEVRACVSRRVCRCVSVLRVTVYVVWCLWEL